MAQMCHQNIEKKVKQRPSSFINIIHTFLHTYFLVLFVLVNDCISVFTNIITDTGCHMTSLVVNIGSPDAQKGLAIDGGLVLSC